MIVRAIDRPSPVPCGLVVKNVSKTSFSLSSGMPVPESATDTSTSVPPISGLHGQSALCRGAVQNGIQPIRRQINDDLLQVNLVGAHGQGPFGLIGAERNASLDCLGLENVEGLRNYLIEVELLQLDLASSSTVRAGA